MVHGEIFFKDPYFPTRCVVFSQKTISRYCPFKTPNNLKKVTKIVYLLIMVHSEIFVKILTFFTRCVVFSPKTISRYCPFTTPNKKKVTKIINLTHSLNLALNHKKVFNKSLQKHLPRSQRNCLQKLTCGKLDGFQKQI